MSEGGMMGYPEPIQEGAVRFSWQPSSVKPDRVKFTIEIDFGETDMSPTEAADVHRSIIGVLRLAFGVRLSQFK